MAIYFVDEDFPKLYSWVVELEFLGYKVIPIGDADRAYSALRSADDIEWVIIDVMLAASEQPDSRYTDGRTDQGLVSGLTLLADLCAVRPDVFPAKAQLLTAATLAGPLAAAEKAARKHNIRLIRKYDVGSPLDFGELILDAMRADKELVVNPVETEGVGGHELG